LVIAGFFLFFEDKSVTGNAVLNNNASLEMLLNFSFNPFLFNNFSLENILIKNMNNSLNKNNSDVNISMNKTIKKFGGGGGGGSGGGGSSSPPASEPETPTENNNSSNNSSDTGENNSSNNSSDSNISFQYPVHQNITVTFFWAGEEASPDNDFIQNSESAWDEKWKEHFGGTDYPYNRSGYFPAGFIPNENSFYFALSYDDFDDGERKLNTEKIYWKNERNWSENESICKNQWIKIIKGNQTAYAQWEDVGPFETNDVDYVFGNNSPRNTDNSHAGLDVSPAVRDFLNLEDIDKVDWQFVNFSNVPDGPWKTKITTSQICWGC